jgi:L-ascorbate metabolism protein UlaG (beta-lactamase superfamily)
MHSDPSNTFSGTKNMLSKRSWVFMLSMVMSSWVFGADLAKADIMWLGQSAFKITTASGKVILTDPWLIANPKTPPQYKKLENLGKIDVLLVSHAHLDHFADAPAIAKLNNIPLWGPGDLNSVTVALGILPPALAPRFNKSGTVTPAPGIQVTAVHAEHSSILVWKNPDTQKDETHFGGEPIGFIIELENGFKIYHMGDTGLFSDMKFIAEYYKPDLVMMPIGGNFTMGPKDAAYAAKELLKVRNVIPMHYGANPLAKGTVLEFQKHLEGSNINVLEMTPGVSRQF